MTTTNYAKMTRAQLIDLLWERRVKGWHHGLVKSGLIWHLERADVTAAERAGESINDETMRFRMKGD